MKFWPSVAGCWNYEKVSRTFFKNQPGFGGNSTIIPYSTVYQDATFEPVIVTIGSILMYFCHFQCFADLGFSYLRPTSHIYAQRWA